MTKILEKANNILSRKGLEYVTKQVSEGFVVKDVDLTKRIVTGVYNTFNYFDSDYDVILPGAAQKSISERGPDSTSVAKIKHLLCHDWTKLPGKIITLQEKAVTVNNKSINGIYFETKMADTQMGTDTLIQYQEEIWDNHSIGFQFLDGEWIDAESENWDKVIGRLLNPEKAEEAGFAYLWKEIKLYEGSTVAFGANDMTPYLGVKDASNTQLLEMKAIQRIDNLQKQLRSGTLSDETLQTFDMEVLQLKQFIREMFSKRPSAKPTLKQAGSKDTAKMITCDACGTDFDAQNMQPDDNGAYACPDCNQLCMPGTKESSFLSNLQFV